MKNKTSGVVKQVRTELFQIKAGSNGNNVPRTDVQGATPELAKRRKRG